MAKNIYVGVNNVAKKPKNIYVGVNGVARKVKAAYVGVNGVARKVWPNSILPLDYQQVEYILNSNSTQYIDTEIKPSSSTRVETSFKLRNVTLNRIFYCHWNYTEYGFYISSNNPHLFYVGFNNTDGGTNIAPTANTVYTVNFNMSNGIFKINGQIVKTFTNTFSNLSRNLYIFPEESNKLEFDLYYFKVWDNVTLVRDMYPCYRISDRVPGLFDIVNNTFYTNKGTGIFYTGPDI